jgi:hypothetical protein
MDEQWRAAYDRLTDRLYAPGRRSTQAGRSHLPWMSLEAKNARIRLVYRAYALRTREGLPQREIAQRVGRSRAWVGDWLRGIPRVKQAPD